MSLSLSPLAGPHWQGAAEGELRVPHCRQCEKLWYPPLRHCPRCLSDDIDWKAIGGQGTVRGACTFHRAYFPGLDLPLPYTVIHVELDAGPQLYSNPQDPASTFAIGQRVQAVFVPVSADQALVRFAAIDGAAAGEGAA